MGSKFSAESVDNIEVSDESVLDGKFAWYKTKDKKYIFYVENKRLDFDLKRTEIMVLNYTGTFDEFLIEQKNNGVIVNFGNSITLNGGKIMANWIEIIGRNSSGIIQLFRLMEFQNIIKDYEFNNENVDLLYSSCKNKNGYYLRFKLNKVNYDFKDFPDLRFENCVYNLPNFIEKKSKISIGVFHYIQSSDPVNSFNYYVSKNNTELQNYMEISQWNSMTSIDIYISPLNTPKMYETRIHWENIKKLSVCNIKELPKVNLLPTSLPPPTNPDTIPIAFPIEYISAGNNEAKEFSK